MTSGIRSATSLPDWTGAYVWLSQHRGATVALGRRPGILRMGVGLPITGIRAVICAVTLSADGDGSVLLNGTVTVTAGRKAGESARLAFDGGSPARLTRAEATLVAAEMVQALSAEFNAVAERASVA